MSLYVAIQPFGGKKGGKSDCEIFIAPPTTITRTMHREQGTRVEFMQALEPNIFFSSGRFERVSRAPVLIDHSIRARAPRVYIYALLPNVDQPNVGRVPIYFLNTQQSFDLNSKAARSSRCIVIRLCKVPKEPARSNSLSFLPFCHMPRARATKVKSATLANVF